jgi:palmitoyltransferase ZDHHC9/14/18
MEDKYGDIKVKRVSGYFKLGNMHCFSVKGWICVSAGPDWGFNVCIIGAILAALAFFLLVMAPKVESLMLSIGWFICIAALISYLLTAFKNPGIVTPDLKINIEKLEVDQICHVCNVPLENTQHCYECEVCVKGYDHHCPLSGKCIGSGNIFFFYTFLISVYCSFIYLAIWGFIAIKNI